MIRYKTVTLAIAYDDNEYPSPEKWNWKDLVGSTVYDTAIVDCIDSNDPSGEVLAVLQDRGYDAEQNAHEAEAVRRAENGLNGGGYDPVSHQACRDAGRPGL